MNQSPASIDSPRQKGGVLVVRRHDHAESFECAEVFGQGKRHARTSARIGSVGHNVFLKFGDEGDARILDAPDFFRIILRVCQQCGLTIDLPSIDAVGRARGTEMRQPTAIFHAAEQQGRAIREQRCARIEDAVDGIWPVLTG